MQVWVPNQINKFVSNYLKIELEDCIDDVFYSEQELHERGIYVYPHMTETSCSLNNETFEPILQLILEKYNEKPENKKTIVVKEIEELTCYKDDFSYSLIEDGLRNFLSEHNISRVGTRLSPKAEKPKKKITNCQLISILNTIFCNYCNVTYGFVVETTYINSDERRCNFIKLLKKNLTFVELLNYVETMDVTNYYIQEFQTRFNENFINDPTNFERLKQVYENPELLNPNVV